MGHVKLTNRSFDPPAVKPDPRRHLTIEAKITAFESEGLEIDTEAMNEALIMAGFTQAEIDTATEVDG